MKPPKGRRGAADGQEDSGELADVLCEFDAVMEDFSSPTKERHFQYEEHLRRMKRHSSAGAREGSGISDSESADSLYRNSFSLSHEKLNPPTLPAPTAATSAIATHKAKLGDTKELEEFIADLDRTLANM